MNQPDPVDFLKAHPAFAFLSAAGYQLLYERSVFRAFTVGQELSDSRLISNEILLLSDGQCRLLCRDEGRLRTVEKLVPGSFVGLASFLRAQACESVIASTLVHAWAIPDELLLELLISEPSFAGWCAAQLFSAELLALVQHLLSDHPRQGVSALHEMHRLSSAAQLIIPSEEGLAQLSAGLVLLAASSNLPNHPIASPINPDAGIPMGFPPLRPRLIAVPRDWYERITASVEIEEAEAARDSAVFDIEESTTVSVLSKTPLASGLSLVQRDSKEFSVFHGKGPTEEALACLRMLAVELKLPFRRDAIENILRDALDRGQVPDLHLCANIAAMMGLHVSGARIQSSEICRLQTPALINWKGGLALVITANASGLKIASPLEGLITLPPHKIEIALQEETEAILLERRNNTPNRNFDLSWFLPELRRYQGILGQVLFASFVVQLFGLANPLLIQVIIDKVITQRSLDTLQVLGFALVVVTIMEGVIGSLRTFLFVQTTNRIDMRLGAEVIDHLLRLPLQYFEKRPVGELGTRIAELEKIRNFLTGQALSTLLDTCFSIIYIFVMLAYSWLLTLLALCVLPLQIGLTIVGAPLFRRQYRESAHENARTQSHLVEVLNGIQTVKAQNVETISRWKWQEYYSKYIARTFEKTITATAINEASQIMQKLSQLIVLWAGAALVLKGEMSLGQLIAFRIISGYVTQPLLRLSSIWQNVQELKVSFERLADVIDIPEESDSIDQSKIFLPLIAGEVKFERVNYSYQHGGPLNLNSINLTIPAGTFVGLVGQSGCGKSTLTKMISRLYLPDSGRIYIDGYDVAKVELYSLRRQIGIVPQEPLLFTGSVAENIALTNSEATSESIVDAAKLACAHDFIMDLPNGYSTCVGERGANLSGGQRQRIALARTLLARPRLLILDEATSALDYETERLVCDSLIANLDHCTVFFITHRLSTIRRADQIVLLHQGAIAEIGSHVELMDRRGRYFALYRQQDSP